MKSFCILGLGKFGTTLAETLAKNGKQVLVIDADADKINAIADQVTYAVIGDPTNEKVLRSAGVKDYQCAVVCMTQINENILLTIMLREMGIQKVIARAVNEGHHKVLEKLGADGIIFPERDTAEKLAFMLQKDNVTEYIDFHGYRIVEIRVPHTWVGKSLIDLELRSKYEVTVLAVITQDGKAEIPPSPRRKFREDEIVSVLGTEKTVSKLTRHVR
ncbi:MAG: TrkA family potassium uptake protein [Clostridia bacterium]|nr:TrkA family potassium uptake protein [Clostridia bacterium]